ncbi:hypothetical protein SAMN05216418_3138, partial [Microbacterium enclense]
MARNAKALSVLASATLLSVAVGLPAIDAGAANADSNRPVTRAADEAQTTRTPDSWPVAYDDANSNVATDNGFGNSRALSGGTQAGAQASASGYNDSNAASNAPARSDATANAQA